jgi:hypothetical protein
MPLHLDGKGLICFAAQVALAPAEHQTGHNVDNNRRDLPGTKTGPVAG